MRSFLHPSRMRLGQPVSLVSAWFILINFVFTTVFPTPAFAQSVLNLPVPGIMVKPTAAYVPPVLRGVKIHPENPLRFDFIVDTGDSKLEGESLKEESVKLIKYFLASLTVPEDDLWVNLSPYEQDRIIPTKFGTTEMGRDLLAQDYLLKQLTASLIYPEDGLGKDFWGKVFKRAYELYGTTNLPINTFNKVWIIPEKAVVYETKDTAFVVESHLKVMLEGDYLALDSNLNNKEFGMDKVAEGDAKAISDLSSKIVKEVVLPEIEKEINTGENFALLRQTYHSLILATWFKKRFKESLLGKVYVDKNKIKGVDVADKQVRQKIYDQYIEAYKKGVYDYVREEDDPYLKALVSRRYVSGGVNWRQLNGLLDLSQVPDGILVKTIESAVGNRGIFVETSMAADNFPKARMLALAPESEGAPAATYTSESGGKSASIRPMKQNDWLDSDWFKELSLEEQYNALADYEAQTKDRLLVNIMKQEKIGFERRIDFIRQQIADAEDNKTRAKFEKEEARLNEEWQPFLDEAVRLRKKVDKIKQRLDELYTANEENPAAAEVFKDYKRAATGVERIVTQDKQVPPYLEKLMQMKPKGWVEPDDPELRGKFRDYLRREGLDRFPSLSRILLEEDTLEMRMIMADLLNHPHWRPIFLQVLPDRPDVRGELNPMRDFKEIESIGGEKLLDEHTSFSIGLMDESLGAAEAKAMEYWRLKGNSMEEKELIEKELKIIVGIADKESTHKLIPKYNPTHGRRIFFRLTNRMYLTIKSIGVLTAKATPYVPFDKYGNKKDYGIVVDNEFVDYGDEFERGADLYPQSLAWRYLFKVTDGKGNLRLISDLSENQTQKGIQIYETTLHIDRLNDLEQILEHDPKLERLAWEISVALSNFYKKEIILTPQAMMKNMLRSIAMALSNQLKQGWDYYTLHLQDPDFAGGLADIIEVNPIVDRVLNLGYYSNEQNLLENFKNLINIYIGVTKVFKERDQSSKALFETLQNGLEDLIKIFFKNLDDDDLDIFYQVFSDEKYFRKYMEQSFVFLQRLLGDQFILRVFQNMSVSMEKELKSRKDSSLTVAQRPGELPMRTHDANQIIVKELKMLEEKPMLFKTSGGREYRIRIVRQENEKGLVMVPYNIFVESANSLSPVAFIKIADEPAEGFVSVNFKWANPQAMDIDKKEITQTIAELFSSFCPVGSKVSLLIDNLMVLRKTHWTSLGFKFIDGMGDANLKIGFVRLEKRHLKPISARWEDRSQLGPYIHSGNPDHPAHQQFNKEGGYREVITDQIVTELKERRYTVPLKENTNGEMYHDLFAAAQEFKTKEAKTGGKFLFKDKKGAMYLNEKGYLVIAHNDFKKRGHVGRGSFGGPVIYVQEDNEALINGHESSELERLFALGQREKFVNDGEVITNVNLGQRFRDWANGRGNFAGGADDTELIRRQRLALEEYHKGHVEGLRAEGRIDEANSYQAVMPDFSQGPIKDFDLPIAGEGNAPTASTKTAVPLNDIDQKFLQAREAINQSNFTQAKVHVAEAIRLLREGAYTQKDSAGVGQFDRINAEAEAIWVLEALVKNWQADGEERRLLRLLSEKVNGLTLKGALGYQLRSMDQASRLVRMSIQKFKELISQDNINEQEIEDFSKGNAQAVKVGTMYTIQGNESFLKNFFSRGFLYTHKGKKIIFIEDINLKRIGLLEGEGIFYLKDSQLAYKFQGKGDQDYDYLLEWLDINGWMQGKEVKPRPNQKGLIKYIVKGRIRNLPYPHGRGQLTLGTTQPKLKKSAKKKDIIFLEYDPDGTVVLVSYLYDPVHKSRETVPFQIHYRNEEGSIIQLLPGDMIYENLPIVRYLQWKKISNEDIQKGFFQDTIDGRGYVRIPFFDEVYIGTKLDEINLIGRTVKAILEKREKGDLILKWFLMPQEDNDQANPVFIKIQRREERKSGKVKSEGRSRPKGLSSNVSRNLEGEEDIVRVMRGEPVNSRENQQSSAIRKTSTKGDINIRFDTKLPREGSLFIGEDFNGKEVICIYEKDEGKGNLRTYLYYGTNPHTNSYVISPFPIAEHGWQGKNFIRKKAVLVREIGNDGTVNVLQKIQGPQNVLGKEYAGNSVLGVWDNRPDGVVIRWYLYDRDSGKVNEESLQESFYPGFLLGLGGRGKLRVTEVLSKESEPSPDFGVKSAPHEKERNRKLRKTVHRGSVARAAQGGDGLNFGIEYPHSGERQYIDQHINRISREVDRLKKTLSEKIKAARDYELLDEILRAEFHLQKYSVQDKQKLKEIVQMIDLLIKRGTFLLHPGGSWGHARRGIYTRDGNLVNSAIWIGEKSIAELTAYELALFLLEEAQHILHPDWGHGTGANQVEHSERLRDKLRNLTEAAKEKLPDENTFCEADMADVNELQISNDIFKPEDVFTNPTQADREAFGALTDALRVKGYELIKIISRIGRGGTEGDVFLARSLSNESQQVVVKVDHAWEQSGGHLMMKGGRTSYTHSLIIDQDLPALFREIAELFAENEKRLFVYPYAIGELDIDTYQVKKKVAYQILEYIEGLPINVYLQKNLKNNPKNVALNIIGNLILLIEQIEGLHMRDCIYYDYGGQGTENLFIDLQGHLRILDLDRIRKVKDFSLGVDELRNTIWVVLTDMFLEGLKSNKAAEITNQLKQDKLNLMKTKKDAFIYTGKLKQMLRALEEEISAMTAELLFEAPGGIDFNPKNFNLETQGEGIEFNPTFDPAQLEKIKIEGLSPVIINIVPITNLPLLMGIAPTKSEDCQEDDPENQPMDKKKRKCLETSPQLSQAIKESEFELTSSGVKR